jgi:uridine kinase|tara:strand:+ start:110 stop:274 length:165 start_codon:yes stop_codon:yes gene_type:complete
MSKGKYYSLKEAREAKDLKGFAKEHPSRGDRELFEGTLERMAKNKPVKKGDRDG